MVNHKVSELDEASKKMKIAIRGIPADSDIWNLYSLSPEDFSRDFADVDARALSDAVAAMRQLLKEIERLKSHKEEKLHSVR